MQRVKTGVLFLFILCMACDWVRLPNTPNEDYDIAEVDEIVVLESYPFPLPWTIQVIGTLPDESWIFDHFELYEEELTVLITPVCKQTSVSLQPGEEVPFHSEMQFYPDKKGVWALTIRGKTKSIQVQVEVY